MQIPELTSYSLLQRSASIPFISNYISQGRLTIFYSDILFLGSQNIHALCDFLSTYCLVKLCVPEQNVLREVVTLCHFLCCLVFITHVSQYSTLEYGGDQLFFSYPVHLSLVNVLNALRLDEKSGTQFFCLGCLHVEQYKITLPVYDMTLN